MVRKRLPRTAVLQAVERQRMRCVGESRQVRHHAVQPAVARRQHAGPDPRQVRRLQGYRSKWYNVT